MSRGQFHLDAATYLAAVRAEVPVYDELQDAVAAASEAVAAERILELGVGTGETARRVLERHPRGSLVAIDSSPDMVTVAAGVLAGADIRVANLQDPLPAGPFELVVSALAVHHLTADDKADLFRRVAACLRPGGRFVLADVVVPDRPEDATTPLEPGVDRPERLADLLTWLAAAGFEADVPWEQGDLVVVAADRSP